MNVLFIGSFTLLLAGIGRIALPAALRFLSGHRLTAPNYAGDVIPVGSGVVLALLFAAMYTFVELLAAFKAELSILLVLRNDMAAYMVVFAAGWMDDAAGDRTVKGLTGHWRNWRATGTPSTGVIKAAAIGMAALWIVLHNDGSWLVRCFDWMIIVMTANAVNLLDVRPGRAWKSFCIGTMLLAAAQPVWERCIWLMPGAAGALALMPGDLNGKHMLGDSGANLLGFALGCSLAYAAPLWLQAAALLMLAAMHRTAEKSSITAWIERHRWARWLDRVLIRE